MKIQVLKNGPVVEVDVTNSFCPTVKGGGVDPSCGKGGSAGKGDFISYKGSNYKVQEEILVTGVDGNKAGALSIQVEGRRKLVLKDKAQKVSDFDRDRSQSPGGGD